MALAVGACRGSIHTRIGFCDYDAARSATDARL